MASAFNPELIISDDQFYNGNAMTAAQIQAFLDQKIGNCTNGKCLNVAVVPIADQPRRVSGSTGNVICEAMAGGTMRVSELIYRSQRACGISAKVILVTLQKEQGLITSRAPSDYQLRYAMGQGCPDTTGCTTAPAGLATQIYTGTRQLKTYRAAGFARQPGVHYIGYHPNAACGGTNLNIRNYATAALYNYTPYQPNRSALNNLYGSGDGCGSYGNRNFWRDYTDWFGSTISIDPLAEIDSAYAATGGAGGPLGAAGAVPNCTPSSASCARTYAGGAIYWTRATGAIPVYGAMWTAYSAAGGYAGALGFPQLVQQNVTDRNGNGIAQKFAGGWIHSSAAGTFTSSNTIMTAYSAAGWIRGSLGWPISAEKCLNNVCGQTFAGGSLSFEKGSPASRTPEVTNAQIRSVYVAQGSQNGALGYAVLPMQTVVDPNGNGFAQKFAGGWIHSSAKGTFASSTAMMSLYSAAGWIRGSLGWPTSAETCTPLGCTQQFERGSLTTPAAGSDGTTLQQSILDEYNAKGGATGGLGRALAPVQTVTDPNGNGHAQKFEGGWIHSSALGTYTTANALMPAYSAAGWLRGALGWPTGPVTPVEDPNGFGYAQKFAGGWIHSSSLGTYSTTTELMNAYSEAGWLRGHLGWPAGPQTAVTDPNGNGFAQKFAGGWIHSSEKGTFASSSKIMTAYSAAGWLRGPLGWPTSAETCANGVCTQTFAGGAIRYPEGGAAYVVPAVSNPQIKSAYDGHGGQSGPLGYAVQPTQTVTDPNGNGYAQKFDGGWIHSSALGTFITANALMPTYSAAGWVRGQLGWPTGAVTPLSGPNGYGYVQTFAGGAIHSSASGTFATTKDLMTAYTAAGGPNGFLGWPAAAQSTVTDPNGNGYAQKFTGGWIHSSAHGTFASSNAIMTAYSAAGWLRGSLGWPTSPETCSNGVCEQQFQGGTLRTG